MSEIRDATPPPGEWTDFFLAEIADRDGIIERLAGNVARKLVILEWIKNNVPKALELCPYKDADV